MRNSKILRRVVCHINSQQVKAKALYSALAEDLNIVCYFLDFQDTNESPVMDLRVSKQPAQSESENALR